MFHTILLLSYTIPNIYVFMRIWQLFINKGSRLLYTGIYLLIAMIYPVSNFLMDGDTGLAGRVMGSVSGYILPFCLYLFLFILAYDIFLLLNLIVRFLKAERMKTTRYKKMVLSLIISLSIIVVVYGSINFNTLRTTRYSIEIPAKSSDIGSLRIAFGADFHLDGNTPLWFVRKFADSVNKMDADLLLLGGDIAVGRREDAKMQPLEHALGEIRTKFGSFAVLGNHEHYENQDIGTFFSDAGITLLRDTIIVIDSSFSLGGRDDSHFRGRKSIGDLVNSSAGTLPLIMLDHRPTDLEEVSKTRVDLQMSGHTHHGQLFPINLITKRVYALSYGYFKKRDTHFFVTSGIRLWGPPVRTTARSEIMLIDITFK